METEGVARIEMLDELGIKKLRIYDYQEVTPDIIECNDLAYVACDLNAIEDLVNDLEALKAYPGPVVTGRAAALMAARIKRAVGLWQD